MAASWIGSKFRRAEQRRTAACEGRRGPFWVNFLRSPLIHDHGTRISDSIVVAAPTIAAPQSGLLAKVRKGSFFPVGPLSAIGVLLPWRQASKGKSCQQPTSSCRPHIPVAASIRAALDGAKVVAVNWLIDLQNVAERVSSRQNLIIGSDIVLVCVKLVVVKNGVPYIVEIRIRHLLPEVIDNILNIHT